MIPFAPPLRAPVTPPVVPTPAPRFPDFTPTEERVIDAFGRGLSGLTVLSGRISRGEYVLRVRIHQHEQECRGTSLLTAMARALSIHDTFTATKEAA